MDQQDTPKVQTQDSQYFADTQLSPVKRNPLLDKLRKMWERFSYYARQFWPYVSRLINFLVYETIKTVKGVVKIGLQQVGMFKE